MNNCIGLKNHKAFILFNMYVALSGGYAAIRGAIEIGLCFSPDYVCNTYVSMLWKVFGFIGIGTCGLFTMFTVVMFFDQVGMKMDDTSTIDQLKKTGADSKDADSKSK
jgi:hypothetical protein